MSNLRRSVAHNQPQDPPPPPTAPPTADTRNAVCTWMALAALCWFMRNAWRRVASARCRSSASRWSRSNLTLLAQASLTMSLKA